MKRGLKLLSIPLALVLLLASLSPGLAIDRQTRLNVMSAVVQMSLVKVKGGEPYYMTWGSGTIISSDGLILTNCHVADPLRFGFPASEVPDYDYLGVSLTVRSDRPPQLSYLAEVVQANPDIDLAVVRIVKTIDLDPVQAEDLNLPTVELGDSDEVEVGDDLNIFGYPGIGGDTVTFTKGVVSGFTLDASIDGRAWIKTDASVSGGNSGGTGVDENGLLVGVPTRAGAGDTDQWVDCRPVKDTNGDGQINDSDDCVPVGGFINALRPVNLALPLIEAARRGLPDPGADEPVGPSRVPSGTAQFSNFFFASGVNEFDQPLSVISSLPSGARSLYLFFDYENMSQENTYELKVFINGTEYPDWGLPAQAWNGQERGLWWIGWSDAEFADGTYELVPYLDGTEVGSATIKIGGSAKAQPSFSNVALSLKATADGKPQEPAVLFPAGTKELTAFFDYQNMSANQAWARTWLMEGEVAATKDDKWSGGRSGSAWVTLSSQTGLAEGAYRVNLYIDGKLSALSNFWITGEQGSGASFEPFVFAEGVDRRGNPVNEATSFASNLEELHAFSGYTGMEDGMDFTVKWYIDGTQVVEDGGEWDAGEEGTWHYYIYSEGGVLPDGAYDLELEVAGQVMQKGSTTIGAGAPPPTPTPPPSNGVQLQGTVTDVDTGKPIDGAFFLVLQPGITLDAFQWTQEEVYAAAETDRKGMYKLPALVERGECYSMLFFAEGYWDFGGDNICIDPDVPDVYDLSVQLEKK